MIYLQETMFKCFIRGKDNEKWKNRGKQTSGSKSQFRSSSSSGDNFDNNTSKSVSSKSRISLP